MRPCRRAVPGITLASHFRALGGDLKLALILSALTIIFLAHQAWLMGDAIIRTLYRLYVSRRNLLEWVPAAQATDDPAARPVPAFIAAWLARWSSARWPLIVGWISGGGNALLAGAFAALWLASPAVARWVSLPPRRASRNPLSNDDAQALRLTARRTWRFFETFVTGADHMLPPDNFQEDPAPKVAHRTSPTNLGLYLLSLASARDFGWLGAQETIERLEATLATMIGMERFRGHFYNWYDTGDLRPLDPKYVSSVDSGNLAGHLIALANACREWRSATMERKACLEGIADALDLTREDAARLRDGRKTQTVTWRQLDDALCALALAAREPLSAMDDFGARLENLGLQADTMLDMARALASERGDETGADMLFWAQATRERHRGASRRLFAQRRSRRGPEIAAGETGGNRPVDGAGHGVRLSHRPQAQPPLDRLSDDRGRARSPTAMTFWPPKRGWRVFSPSPRAIFPPATGSSLAARRPLSLMAPR